MLNKDRECGKPSDPAPQHAEDCTCASFFTVRGVHKESCPSFTPEDSWELDEKLEHLVEHILYQDARGFGIDSGIKRDWQDYFRTQIQKAEERGYQEGKKESDELTKAIHLYNTDGIKALKEAENRGYQEGLRRVQERIDLIQSFRKRIGESCRVTGSLE